MPYLGNNLEAAFKNYKSIDDISSSFNGSTTTFALQVNSLTPVPFPRDAQNCLISIGGVIQKPDSTGTTGFKLSGTNIVFSSAPAIGESFFGVILAGADYVNAGVNYPDGTAGAPSITWSDDTDTGFYRSGAGTTSATANGSQVLEFPSSTSGTFSVLSKLAIGTTSATGKLTIHNSDDANVNVLEVFNDNGNNSGGFSQASDGDGTIFAKKNDGTLSIFLRSDGNSYFNGGNLAVGTTNPTNKFHCVSSDYQTARLESSATDANGVYLEFYANSSSPADNDISGLISFKGKNSAAEETTYAQIRSYLTDVTDGTEDGEITFHTRSDGTFAERLRITSAGKVHSKDAVQSGGNTTGGFQFDAVDTACVLGIQQPSSGSDANAAIQVFDGTSNNLRINYSGLIKTSEGIDFSGAQTNTGGMTSELLDAYEEGTWTPSMATGTVQTQNCKYTRIGRFVKVSGEVWDPSNVSSSNAFQLGGLPFSSPNGTAAGCSFAKDVNVNTPCTYVSSSTYITFYGYDSTNAWVVARHSHLDTTTYIYFEASYQTS